MLKEGPTPMTAYVTDAKAVCLGMEVGGDQRKDVQRDAVDVNERVPPLADVRQRGRDIPVELGDVVKAEAVKEVGVLLIITQDLAREPATVFRDVRWRIGRVLQPLVQGESELRERQVLSGVAMYVH